MLMLMLTTLISTLLTNFSANFTNRFCILTIHRHQLTYKPTNIRALDIKTNTFAHHFKLLFFKAGCSTVIASSSTAVTCFNAISVLFCHVSLLICVAGEVSMVVKKDACQNIPVIFQMNIKILSY